MRRAALPETADVVVVGGGLAGLLVAGWLAESGADVVLCEATDRLGGAWGMGLVELGVTEYPSRTIASLGERAEALLAWSRRSKELLTERAAWERCGTVWVPVLPGEEAEVVRSVVALRARGREAETVPPEALAPRGLTALHPCLSLPGDGRLRAHGWKALGDWASAAGARVVTGCAVRLVDDDLMVQTERGAVGAEAVVLTSGVGGRHALHPILRGFQPVRQQALRIAGGSALPAAGRAGQGWTSWRVDADEVSVSGARWASPHLEVGERDPVVTEAVQGRLEAFARGPLGLEGEVVERWAWVFSQSPDGLPIVGPMPGDPRVVGCVGFGPSAAGLAVAAARSVVDGLMGEGHAEVPWLLSTRRTVRWRYGR